jgi:hypothetical protein
VMGFRGKPDPRGGTHIATFSNTPASLSPLQGLDFWFASKPGVSTPWLFHSALPGLRTGNRKRMESNEFCRLCPAAKTNAIRCACPFVVRCGEGVGVNDSGHCSAVSRDAQDPFNLLLDSIRGQLEALPVDSALRYLLILPTHEQRHIP